METWLDEHLETFVRPRLGSVPNVDPKDYWVKRFPPARLVAMNLIWAKTKVLAKGRTILLPGRDVYLFEVIARMLNDYPTICRVDVSSEVAQYVVEDYTETFVLDTGYKGSVPRAMGIPNWALIRYSVYPYDKDTVKQRQVFPKANRGPYLDMSSTLEGCPKYWTRAFMKPTGQGVYKKGDPIIQDLELNTTFLWAAILTQHVARSVRCVSAPWFTHLFPWRAV